TPEGAGEDNGDRDKVQRAAGGLRQAHGVDRDEATETGEDHVERMCVGVDEPVHLFGAVMNGVKVPEERYCVRPPVSPVEAEFADEECGGEADGEGKGSDIRVESGGDDAVKGPADERHRDDEDEFREKVIQEIEEEIRQERFAEYLLRVQSANPFQRDEDHHDDEKPKAEPQEIESESDGGGRHRRDCRPFVKTDFKVGALTFHRVTLVNRTIQA